MNVVVLLLAAAVLVEIIGIVLFLKKTKSQTFLKKHKVILGVFIALQIFAVISMFVLEKVFGPSFRSSIQNPSSKALSPLLQKQDFPDSWTWISSTTQQPSSFPWKDSPIDSAESVLIAKAPRLLIFREYVRVFHWTALYAFSVSEEEFMKRISHGGDDETSFVPAVNKVGKYFYAMCNKGSDFYACDISIGYEHLISYLLVITPQDLGEQFTINLLNSSIQIIDRRVK